jgi:hypothetical protein
MVCRLIIVGLAAALAAPLYASAAATAAALFSCPSIDSQSQSSMGLNPGLSCTQTAQTLANSLINIAPNPRTAHSRDVERRGPPTGRRVSRHRSERLLGALVTATTTRSRS